MTPQRDEDRARGRYWIISLTRLMGAIMATLGFLVVAEVIEWPVLVGYVLIVVGLVDAFVMPVLLAKRWKTPEQ